MKKTLLTIMLALISSLSCSAASTDDIFNHIDITASDSQAEQALLNAENLPELTTPQAAIASGVQLILGWSMFLALIAIIAAAIFYLIAQGNEEEAKKAKDIIKYLVIGAAIISSAYAIVIGISKFDFFTTGV
ncbi:hypothetical protein KJ632_04805 [Patescibacteria group bacterium]|nr:hypothetical protein [Patescibacteria group bacterium]